MSIIKLKAKISEKKQSEKLSDEKLSDTVGGVRYCWGEETAKSVQCRSNQFVVHKAMLETDCPGGTIRYYVPAKNGDRKDHRLGKLIGYCTDCKCPVYSVTRKNHAGHNVITGAGR